MNKNQQLFLPCPPLLSLQVRHLEDFLSAQGRPCHIIWTSSSTASKCTFDPDDLQGEHRSEVIGTVCGVMHGLHSNSINRFHCSESGCDVDTIKQW